MNDTKPSDARIPWPVWLIAIYLLACFLPEVKGVSPQGFVWLIALPMAMIIPAWWANPLFFAGCVALARGRNGLACGLGVVATLLASTFFMMLFPQQGIAIFRVPGADCWLLRMVSLAAAGFMNLEQTTGLEKPDRP